MQTVSSAVDSALWDAADAAELEALLPQLIAARSHVDDARALLRKGEDLVAGVATSAPSPAASNGSALQQREPQHGDTLHIPKLGIWEFIGVSPELSAGAIRSAARKTVEVLPGLRSAQLAAKDMLESITEIQADSGPIVERIKSLHALQLAARETLERVQDLSDLKACLADLSEAMHQHQFEDAAMSIKQFRALENKLHVDESDLEFVSKAQSTVRQHVQQKFDEAVTNGDASKVTYFYQLLTVLGGSVDGMSSYAQFTCTSATRDLLGALGVPASHPAVLRTIKHCTAALKSAPTGSSSADQEANSAPGRPAPSAESVVLSIQGALFDVLQGVFDPPSDASSQSVPPHIVQLWQEAGSSQAVFVNALACSLGRAVQALTDGVQLARGNMEAQGDAALAKRIAADQAHSSQSGSALTVRGALDPASPAITVLLAVHLPAQLAAAALLRMFMASRTCVAASIARGLEAALPPAAIAAQVRRQLGPLVKHPSGKAIEGDLQDALRAAEGGASGSMVWDALLRGGGVCNARQEDTSERVLDEVALVLQKCASYFRTVAGTCAELDTQAETVLGGVLRSLRGGQGGPELQREVTAQGSVRGASALLECVGELAALYTQLEEGSLRRGMAKSIALQEITQYPPVLLSTLDDMGFVVKRVMSRATATGNADVVCAMLHLTAELLVVGSSTPTTPCGLLFPPVAAALAAEDGEGVDALSESASWGSQAAAVLAAPRNVPMWGIGAVAANALRHDISAAALPTSASTSKVLDLVTCAWSLKRELQQAVQEGGGGGVATSAMKLPLRSPQFTSPPRARAPPPAQGAEPESIAPSTPRRGAAAASFTTPSKAQEGAGGVLYEEGGLQFPASAIAAANALNTVFQAADVAQDLLGSISADLDGTFVGLRGDPPPHAPAAAAAEGAKAGAALEQLQEATKALRQCVDAAVDALFAGLSPRFRGAMTVMEGKNAILRYDEQGGDMGGYDVFHGEFLGALENIVGPYHALIEPSACEVFLGRVCSYVCRQVSAHCRRKRFTQRGALQFDGHVRALCEFFEERGVWRARHLASALQTQAAMLLCDSRSEAEEVWAAAQQAALGESGPDGNASDVPPWAAEGPPFCEAILKLRSDWAQ